MHLQEHSAKDALNGTNVLRWQQSCAANNLGKERAPARSPKQSHTHIHTYTTVCKKTTQHRNPFNQPPRLLLINSWRPRKSLCLTSRRKAAEITVGVILCEYNRRTGKPATHTTCISRVLRQRMFPSRARVTGAMQAACSTILWARPRHSLPRRVCCAQPCAMLGQHAWTPEQAQDGSTPNKN